MKLTKVTGSALRNGWISQMVMSELCERWSNFPTVGEEYLGSLGEHSPARPRVSR